MADLRSIMNLDEEHHDARVNKRETGPSSPPTRSFQSHPSPVPDHHPPNNLAGLQPQPLPHPLQHQRHTQYCQHRDPQAHMDPTFYDHRGGPYTQYPSSMPPEDYSSTSSSSRLSSGHHQPYTGAVYTGSNTPEDHMDHQQGFSHNHHVGAAPQSLSSPPMTRAPIVSRAPYNGTPPMESQPSVKLTPVTGRVSKALKGVPVHTCHECIPSRTFSRNEHLKRHQLGHKNPSHECRVAGCGRKFHRKDLLDRHEQKHGVVKDRVPRRGSQSVSKSRRPSKSATFNFASSMTPRLGALSYATPRERSPSLQSCSLVSPTDHATRPSFGAGAETGSFDPTTPLSPDGIPTPNSYQQPASQARTVSRNGYMFSSPPSHPMSGPNHHRPTDLSHHDLFTFHNLRPTHRRPSLHIQFLPPAADNPPDLLPAHDPAGIPSSASSTSYSPASEFSRHKSNMRSPSVDWVDHGGFLAPSPFPADMLGPVGLDQSMGPTSSSAAVSSPISPGTIPYSSYSSHIVGTAPAMFATDMGVYADDALLDERQQEQSTLPSPKRRFGETI